MAKEWKEETGKTWSASAISNKFGKLTSTKRASYEQPDYETGAVSDLQRLIDTGKTLAPEEWKNYGEILKRVDEAKQWAIGDWLVDGKTHYGDRLYREAAGILDIQKGYLQNLKSISQQFEFSHRCENLSWKHHYEVAPVKIILQNNKRVWQLNLNCADVGTFYHGI
jgi:hypothetical protein